jgi:hypothetical protein
MYCFVPFFTEWLLFRGIWALLWESTIVLCPFGVSPIRGFLQLKKKKEEKEIIFWFVGWFTVIFSLWCLFLGFFWVACLIMPITGYSVRTKCLWISTRKICQLFGPILVSWLVGGSGVGGRSCFDIGDDSLLFICGKYHFHCSLK